MRILIVTAGTRGDVQPFIALGKALLAAEHSVVLCTSCSFADSIREHGIEYAYMNDDLVKFLETGEGRETIMAASSPVGWFRKAIEVSRRMKPILRKSLEEQWAAASGDIDMIIYHPKAGGGYHIAEKLGIPGIMSVPIPILSRTSAFANPIFPQARLGGWYNLLSYRLLDLAFMAYGDVRKAWRRETLGLPERRITPSRMLQPDGTPVPIMYPCSRYVIPTPPDWPPTVMTTGYWFLDESASWAPTAKLDDFLKAGDPPVYVGFGSMAASDPATTTSIVIDALAKSGQRGILATGWGGLKPEDLPDNMTMIDSAPHDWLFPRTAAIVHHGGAGTTAAALRAGKPSIVCPFFADQPFWGNRVYEIGAGTRPIRQKKLTATNLAEAITIAVSNDAIRDRACEIGESIRSENGLECAVRFVEDTSRSFGAHAY